MSPISTKDFSLSEKRFSDVVRRELVLKNRILTYGTGLIIAVIAGLCVWGYSRGIGGQIFMAWLPMLIIVAAWWFWLLWGMQWYSFRHQLNQGGFTRRRYVFHGDYLVLETEDGVYLKAPYRHFPRIRLGPDYVMLQETMATFHVLPMEFFETTSDAQEVRGRLESFVASA
jgi:hypothetical protein